MHWFVLASQKEVRIFVQTSDGPQLKLLKTVTNPLGTEKRRALIRKEAGHGTKSIGHVGSVHYTEGKRHDPREEASIQFARELAHFLKSEKLKKHFDTLTVVAEAHLMGKIKAEMDSHLKECVVRWLKKDLQNSPEQDLAHFLVPRAAG